MKKLYVGGLPFRFEDTDLAELFAPYGKAISATIIRDRAFNNRSKGFGFVEMEGAEADAAIAALDQSELDGRSLTVNEARPMEARAPRTGGFGGSRDGGSRGGFGGSRDGGSRGGDSRGGRDRDSY
jgi:RNA recognition motif-containing protein